MKRVLPVLAVIMLLSTSAAFAEDGAGGPPPGARPGKEGGPQGGPPGEGGERPQMTEEMKKEMFAKHKAERIAKIKEHLACVEKATDRESMKACRPKHDGKRGGGEGGWGKRGGGEGGEGRGPRGGDDGAPE